MNRSTALATFLAAPIALALPAHAQETLALATLPVDASAQVFYAVDMGFLKRAGLAVELHKIKAGEIPAAVAAGTLDIGWSNIISLAIAHQRGADYTVVATGGVYTRGKPTSALFVAKDSPIRAAHDLNGKTIASDGTKNMGQFATQYWIDRNGGDSATTRFVELPFAEMKSALTGGKIDAAFVGEPYIEQAQGAIRMIGAPLDLIAPRTMIGAWFTTTTWAQRHAATVKAFRQAMAATALWANDHQAQSGAILAKYIGIEPSVAQSMRRIAYGTRLQADEMQGLIDLVARYHAIPAPFPATALMFTED